MPEGVTQVNPAEQQTTNGNRGRWMLGIGAASAAAITAAVLLNGGSESESSQNATTTVAEGTASSNEVPTSGTVASSTEASVSTSNPETADETTDALRKIFDNPTGIFQCMDEGEKTGTMRVVTLPNGIQVPGEVLLKNLDVDETKPRSQDFRLWTDAVSNPITADLNDKEKVALELFATWCEQPAALAAALVEVANSPFNGVLVGDAIEWLKPYVGKTVEEINDIANDLTLPLSDPEASDEQIMEVNNKRVELAEKMADAHLNLQNMGVYLGVDIASSVGLKLPDAINTSNGTPEFVRTGEYTGNALVFNVTTKIGEKCVTLAFGYNTDEQRPVVVVIDQEKCEPDETTTVPDTTGPDTTGPDTTVRDTRPEVTPVAPTVIQGGGDGGEPDSDNDPDNNVTTVHATTTSTSVAGTTTTTTTIKPSTTIKDETNCTHEECA